jgi:hypothetical protein
MAEVEPSYAVENEGAVKRGDPRSVAFAIAQLATRATVLRNINAWNDGANTPIGYPMVNVRDIESGAQHGQTQAATLAGIDKGVPAEPSAG